MLIFVTGGSGFVGRNLIRSLIARGHSVRALARSEVSRQMVSSLGAVPIAGDLVNTAALHDGLRGCDALVHAAADVSQTRTSKAQERTNVTGTSLVFRTARAQGVSRGIHISTEAVLADGTLW
jgi:nucleoside-diphosphate-sugar epimerase